MAAKRQSCDGALWQARGMHFKAQGAIDQARRAFAQGVALEPTHTAIYHAWGTMEAQVGAPHFYRRPPAALITNHTR
eukprot:scaffold227240_cov32-Tisochrysis_lutea.AAC.2